MTTQIVDAQAAEVIQAIDRAEEFVATAREGMAEAIGAKLQAAALVASMRAQKGRMFSDWWTGNIGHRYGIEVGKALCKLDALARKRPVDADRSSLTLVGLLPGPRHDDRDGDRDGGFEWNGIADYCVGIAAQLDKLVKLIDLYNRTLDGVERDMAEGRVDRFRASARAALSAVDEFMGIV